MSGDSLENIVNTSITQTLARSVYTNLTSFVMILALFIVGVTSMKEFALPLMVGILAGTYSSICITGSLYYLFNKKKYYDIDGVCATYILISGLKELGAVVDTDIPDRIADGYGLNGNLILKAYNEDVDTILTCDNGIAAVSEIAYAKELGMNVIVTDHHNPGEVLPPADAIVNPKQKDCGYPFKEICGATVAYKLIQGLYEKMNNNSNEYEKYLEYAAIATIGDVVILQDENRIIAKEGLRALNRTKNLGLKALIHVNKLDGRRIDSYHIGFILGPCLNASGRLDTAKKALALLEECSEARAMSQALELYELNAMRKDMTMTGFERRF
jgi:single-stranded-DNA-specific exonuclease